jgi:hypothetical protein
MHSIGNKEYFMGKFQKLDQKELKVACFGVARNTMWDRRPIDVAKIEFVADQLYKIAIDYNDFITEQRRDPNIITRAVMYLSTTHAIPPMRDDIRWFSDMLAVLVELACPNTIGSNGSDQFYHDIEKGIASSKREE